MSFRCGKCNKVSLNGKPATKEVLKKRNRQYENRLVNEETRNERNWTTSGWEIVEERTICTVCAGIEAKQEILLN